MLAAKFFDDHYYNNTYYAKIGGVPRNEMNILELEFLFLVNFSLYLDPNEYRKYHTELCSDNTQTGNNECTNMKSQGLACLLACV